MRWFQNAEGAMAWAKTRAIGVPENGTGYGVCYLHDGKTIPHGCTLDMALSLVDRGLWLEIGDPHPDDVMVEFELIGGHNGSL